MALHWGTDCATDITGGELERVANALQAPAFCGRYWPTYACTPAEAAYMHARGGKILCIVNEDQNGSQMGGSYDAGHAAGQRAAQGWAGIGAPKGVCLYLDAEQSFYFSPDYLAGYADGCASLGYAAGIYLNSLSGNQHNESYIAARAKTATPISIFASEPQPYSLANRVADVWVPAAPSGFLESVVVHQYCINFGDSDLDLATDAGLALMWRPTPPAPKTWRVSVAGALKSTPLHSSKPAIGPGKKRVDLKVGDVVLPTGKTQHTDDQWTELRFTNSVVHGWFPESHLRSG